MLLNADVGEGLVTDTLLYPFLDQANIACGGHTGNQQSMQQAVAACIEHDVIIGAHPSYPDTANFGRSSIDLSAIDLTQSLQQQIQSLIEVCDSLGAVLSYIKPHGALYNDIMAQAKLFDLVVEVVADNTKNLDLMLGAVLPEEYIDAAKRTGVNIIREAFADRQYLNDGQLAPRTQQGAVFSKVEQIYSQVTGLNVGMVKDERGGSIALQAQSVCIHGDNPASVQAIQTITQILNKA